MSDKLQAGDILRCKKICKMRGWQFVSGKHLRGEDYRVLIKDLNHNYINYVYNSFDGGFTRGTIPTDKKNAQKYFTETP